MTPELPFDLPAAFTEWMPAAQATTLGLATLVQEDVPTIAAAVISGTGRLAWPAAFLGCFLGIWIGDALLYLLARILGRSLLQWSWAQRCLSADAIAQSERWFASKGTWLLVTSRFVPGTRLPTYLAAGFLRIPFHRFLLITGIVVAIWTSGIFVLAQVLGAQLTDRLRTWNQGWILLVAFVVGVASVRLAPRFLRRPNFRGLQTAVGRWRRWEFWPAWLFYLPVALNYLRLAVKYRGWTLPSTANPGIATGGLVGESKFDLLQALHQTSPEFTAQAWLIPGGNQESRASQLGRVCEENSLSFPLVLKPDVGHRGYGVKLIRTEKEARDYLRFNRSAVIVQRYVPGPLEVGVFYYRFPEQPKGRVFAITEKIFPILTGDGVRTVEELIWHDDRARYLASRYLKRFHSRRNEVLAKGDHLRLVEAGNHAQGCIFRDGAALWSKALEDRMDAISQRLPGFFIGRYDLRFATEADLREGLNFSILELNGASAEATSIYDARNSLSAAYAMLFRQWELVFAIGAANRSRGARPTPPLELIRAWSATNRLLANYPAAD